MAVCVLIQVGSMSLKRCWRLGVQTCCFTKTYTTPEIESMRIRKNPFHRFGKNCSSHFRDKQSLVSKIGTHFLKRQVFVGKQTKNKTKVTILMGKKSQFVFSVLVKPLEQKVAITI